MSGSSRCEPAPRCLNAKNYALKSTRMTIIEATSFFVQLSRSAYCLWQSFTFSCDASGTMRAIRME